MTVHLTLISVPASLLQTMRLKESKCNPQMRSSITIRSVSVYCGQSNLSIHRANLASMLTDLSMSGLPIVS